MTTKEFKNFSYIFQNKTKNAHLKMGKKNYIFKQFPLLNGIKYQTSKNHTDAANKKWEYDLKRNVQKTKKNNTKRIVQ